MFGLFYVSERRLVNAYFLTCQSSDRFKETCSLSTTAFIVVFINNNICCRNTQTIMGRFYDKECGNYLHCRCTERQNYKDIKIYFSKLNTLMQLGPFQMPCNGRANSSELGKFDCGTIIARRLKTTRVKVV